MENYKIGFFSTYSKDKLQMDKKHECKNRK